MGITEHVFCDGFAFLPSYHPFSSSEEALASLGSLIALSNNGPVHFIKPKSSSLEMLNTYSGNFGHGVFPFHTDLAHHRRPPRYLVLRCIKGHPSVKTKLIDSKALITRIGETSLRRALVRSRKRVRGEAPIMRLLEGNSTVNRFRWDQLFLIAASPFGANMIDQLSNEIERQKSVEISLVELGDTLIVDNWRMLHSRSSVPDTARNRILVRSYMEELA